MKSSIALAFIATATIAMPVASAPPAGRDGTITVPAADLDAMQSTIKDLQKQVDELKSANDDKWLTQKRSDEIRGLVHDVLADADTRASLMQSGAVAGWDNGFFIGSSDGNYLLRIAGQLQFRGVYNSQDNSPVDDTRYGFEMRRVKVDFRGHVFDPSWAYYVETSYSQSTGVAAMGENVWIQKDLGNGMKVRFGQFKPAFAREENISARRLQAVERSMVNSQFTAGVAQGVQTMYEADKWRVSGSFIDGANTGNTAWSVEDTEYAVTGRFEYLLSGAWKTMDDDIGFKGDEGGLMLGAAMLFQNQEYGTGNNLPSPDFNNAEAENLTLTGDLVWKNNGWSVAASAFYRMLSVDATDVDLDQYAFVLRGGFFIQDDLELYAMYEWGDLDIDGVENLSVITVGITKYFNKHNLKWQSDIGYGFNEVASAWAVDSAGWRADGSDEDGQIVIRTQFQLLF